MPDSIPVEPPGVGGALAATELLCRVRKEAQGISGEYQSAFNVNPQGLPELESSPLYGLALPREEGELDRLVDSVSTPIR